jgi:serpin B
MLTLAHRFDRPTLQDPGETHQARNLLGAATNMRPSFFSSVPSLLALLAFGPVAACSTSTESSGTNDPPTTPGPSADEVPMAKASIPRSTAPAVAPADAKSLTSDNTAFAADVYKSLRTSPQFEGENLFFSPHSISVALAMTYAGARGTTESEMASALRFTLPQDRLHPAFNALDLALSSRGAGAKAADGEPFRLRVTNSLWGLPKMPFEQPFLGTLAESYGAGIRLTDFANDPEGSRQTINKWVDVQTEQRIPELLPQDSVNPLTRLVLVNAVYFNAAWKDPFDAAITKPATFHGLGGDIDASFMASSGPLRHARGSDYDAIALPYDGNELELLAIVPDSGKLDALEARLDGAMLESVASSLETREVQLKLPKFEIKGKSFSLRETLRALGMKAAFEPDASDLTGMLPRSVDHLYIADVIHDAFVSVDEKGTEAAAATAVLIAGRGAPTDIVKLTVDRPYVYGVRDLATGAFVFLGRVAKP